MIKREKRKIYTIVLAVVSLFVTAASLIIRDTFAAPTTAVIDSEGYIMITTASQLDAIRNRTSGRYRLYADIDLKEYVSMTNQPDKGWYPIGYGAPYFRGEFDGNGHTISGLWSNNKACVSDKGLFSVLMGAIVMNVNIVLEPAGISGASHIGAIAGEARNGSVIQNCTVRGGQIAATGSHAGGIVGFTYGDPNVVMKDCIVYDTYIKTEGNYAGGIVGAADDQTLILRCQSVNVGVYAASYAGGLAGAIKGYSAVSNACAGGTVNTKASYAGGLVGIVYEGSAITGSYAASDVSANHYSGGLVGALHGNSTISRSCAYGNVTVNNYIAGGLVGEAIASRISNSFARGNVIGSTGVGGLVGYFSGSGKANDKSVENCYSSGAVTGTGTAEYGAFNGRSGVEYLGTNYYDADKALVSRGYGSAGNPSGKTDSYPQGISTLDMMKQDSFSGWDFNNIWTIDENQSYPYLKILTEVSI